MGLGELTSRDAVLAAVGEFDELGREAFLRKYGFGPSRDYALAYDGKHYDSKAIVGAAHGFEHPADGPLRSDAFSGGTATVVRKLESLGFEVARIGESTTTPNARVPRLFFFTAANPNARQHMETSLRRGVPLEQVYALGEVLPELQAHAREGRVYAWGARSGSNAEQKWERLETGDIGLVYFDGAFRLWGRVYAKSRSEEVARSIWGSEPDGRTWECMTFLDPVEEIEVDLDKVTAPLGYRGNYVPQGFEIPGNGAQERLLERFGSVEEFLTALTKNSPPPEVGRRFWWVNQGASFDRSREGGYLWAPNVDRRGNQLAHWSALKEAQPGDVVLNYANNALRATSTVLQHARPAQRQDDRDQKWERDGQLVRVEYNDLGTALALTAIPEEWRIGEDGPFDQNGKVKQGYFFPLSYDFVQKLAARFPELGLADQTVTAVPHFGVETVRAAAERRQLRLSDGIYSTVVAALNSGKHVIFTGPPGTAKTTLAQAVAEAATGAGLCAGYVLTTATADWTTYETIGGLRPKTDGRLEFEEGHFLAAIRGNRWLVIDELNRSNFDRAFGQLFTVLSGQPVVLPYTRAKEKAPLTIVPAGASAPNAEADVLKVPDSWRVIATMNVFDKSLLFEMSYALMRRFAFIEIAAPEKDVFEGLIDDWAQGDEEAAAATKSLLALRDIKDIGPAAYRDIARYAKERRGVGIVDRGQLCFECFYSYLLPQFEGVSDEEGERLFKAISLLCGRGLRSKVRNTLNAVLGLELQPPREEEPEQEREVEVEGEENP